ncbi:hypothetical protein HDU83_001857 [Entophlyctis luteolus]|nr:hypothetical protein HDU83_001857 [Entophlyctis luteolus]
MYLLVLGALLVLANRIPLTQPQPIAASGHECIIGRCAPQLGWDLASWEPVTDRVRGGRSTAAARVDSRTGCLVFAGTLDTSALGGAGFASVRRRRPLDLSAFRGLAVRVARAAAPPAPRVYALNLVDEVNEGTHDRGDGRRASSIEFKFSFDAPVDGGIVQASFDDFVPYYRGKPVENGPRIDTRKIVAISLMIQSYFDKQQGDYELVLESITGLLPEDSEI